MANRRVKVFRILSALLMLLIAVEIIGIINTQTYDAELKEAKAAYEEALAENTALKKSSAWHALQLVNR